MKAISVVATLAAALMVAPVYAQNGKLKTTAFPDGTGSIGLAPGWHIDNAYRGAVACAGPNGAVVILKMPYVILRPESSVAQLPGAAQQPIARAGDIVGALRAIMVKNGGVLGKVRGKRLQSLDSGAPAYLLHYEFKQGGKQWTAIGYFATLDYGSSQPMWQLYSSAVAAPTTQFTKTAPAMLAMWKSWRPNGNKPSEGSTSAVFDDILKDRKASYEEIQKKFREQL